jgi:hypothetical protein
MNKISLERMNSVAAALDSLAKEVRKYAKKGIPVDSKLSITNTGIIEGPSDYGWKTYYSLGGKSITIDLSFPNTKTLGQAIKEIGK